MWANVRRNCTIYVHHSFSIFGEHTGWDLTHTSLTHLAFCFLRLDANEQLGWNYLPADLFSNKYNVGPKAGTNTKCLSKHALSCTISSVTIRRG